MTRGLYMQLRKTAGSENEMAFLVLASGWDIGESEPMEVGQLVVNVPAETATFSPSGPWLHDVVVAQQWGTDHGFGGRNRNISPQNR